MSLPNEENDKSSSSDAQGMGRSLRQQSLCNHRQENIMVILSSDSASICLPKVLTGWRWKQKRNWRHPSVFQPKGGNMNWDPTIHHMLPSSTTFVGLRILRHPAALPVSMFRIMTIDPYWNGCNMSTPKTEKFSEICENGCVRYGLSSVQGWRTKMEDFSEEPFGLWHQANHKYQADIESNDPLFLGGLHRPRHGELTFPICPRCKQSYHIASTLELLQGSL